MRRFLCSFDNFEADAYDFDVIIVGSGVAGLYAALHIDPALQVALVTTVTYTHLRAHETL